VRKALVGYGNLQLRHQFDNHWLYVLEPYIGLRPSNWFDFTPSSTFYGINQEWFHTVSENTALGGRFEVFEPDFRGGMHVEITTGLNRLITRNFLVRPELRWDWSDQPDAFPGRNNSQLLTACDAIWSF
jgi:hypothetical protein